MKRIKIGDIIFFSCSCLYVVWGLYWLAIAAYYCAPNVEDFSLSIRPREQGLITSVVNLLVFYDSRYTDAFLHGLNPLAFNWVAGFIIMPFICVLFFATSLYYFITSFITSKNIRLFLLGYVLLFVITHYATETQLPCGLFLMVSTFNYIYPWFFTFIWLGSLLRTFSQTSEIKRILLSVIGYFSLLLSFGCTEFFVSINGFVLLSLFLYALAYDRAKLKYIIPYCMVAMSSVVFIFLCPSQKIIGGKIFTPLSERYPDSNFVVESAKIFVHFFLHYVLHPLSLCFVLVTSFFFRKVDITTRLNFTFSKRQLALICLGSVIITYLTSWVFFIPIGSSGFFPRYNFNSLLILPQIGLFIFLPLYLNQWFAVKQSNRYLHFAESVAATLFVALLLFSENNIRLIKRECETGIIQQVRNKAEKFYSRVKAAKALNPKHTIVYFENPDKIPQSNYFGPDVMPNRSSACWNMAYEEYFEVDEVRLVGDTIFK